MKKMWGKIKKFKAFRDNFGFFFSIRLIFLRKLHIMTGYRIRWYHTFMRKFCDRTFQGLEVEPGGIACAGKEPASDRIPVWVLWLQGLEEAPEVVKVCIKSQREHLPEEQFDYHLLDWENLNDFLTFPDIIERKYEEGKISKAHLSDFIRTALLKEYGGIWLDASIYLTGELDNRILRRSLYSIRERESVSGRFVTEGRWMMSFFEAERNNLLMRYLDAALLCYWKNYDILVEYLLIDYIIDWAYRAVPEIKRQIDEIPIDNLQPYALFKKRNEAFTESGYQDVIRGTSIHKLSYKYPCRKETADGRITFWGYLLQHNEQPVL